MPSNKIITIVHNDNKLSIDTAKVLRSKLIAIGYSVNDSFNPNAELVVCIGGDGRFLQALHDSNFSSIPIIGINTGNLGFFTEITPKFIDNFINKYINKDYTIQEIIPIEGAICTTDDCIKTVGVNEIVIKANKSVTVHLSIYVNNNLIQRFSGDGILISTSTGSTAYNYSAGGSIVDPSLNVLQITPLAPMNTIVYRSFTSSIILPSDAVIKVVPEYRFEDSILVVSDGVEHKYTGITEIDVKLSDLRIKMLRLEDFEFWNRVSEKFL